MKKFFAACMGVVMAVAFTSTSLAAGFADVPDEHPYKNAIEFCNQKGYIQGITSTSMAPDATLTRAQFATIWCRALSLDNTNHTFSDISPMRNYYDSSVIALRSLGLLQGTSATEFSVNSDITREQLALIAKQSHRLGVANAEDYKTYTDHALISDWARDGVSAAINANIFRDLFDDEELTPQKAVTRGELCQLIYNINMPAHAITVDTLTGGKITPDVDFARAGETVSLEIKPDPNMQLKAGTLKYNGEDITGTSFVMPGEDVLITAEFEAAPVPSVNLVSIAVTSPPTQATYTQGQTLSLDGLVITATYFDTSSTPITGYTTDPADGATLDNPGEITVQVSYTEGNETVTTSFVVTVNPST